MGAAFSRRLGTALVALALGGAACSSAHSDALDRIKFARIAGPMPVISGRTLTGNSVKPADYSGKVVLLNFWASWCAPCRREQPGLQALWSRLEGSGKVAFIGVDYRDQAGPARGFLHQYAVAYPSVSDPVGELGVKFNVPYLPATILIDGRGQLRYRLVGAQDPGLVGSLIRSLWGTAR